MQAYILLKDSFGGEVRIPVNVTAHAPAPVLEPEPEQEAPAKPGHGRWNKSYTPQFRATALELGRTFGAGKTAKFLGIPDSTVDNWVRADKARTAVRI